MCAQYHSFDSSREPDVDSLRDMFFRSISKLAPEVWADLKEDVYPFYEKVVISNGVIGDYKMIDSLLRDSKTQNPKDVEGLKESLEAWSKKYNLFDEWILDRAFVLLEKRFISEFYWTDENSKGAISKVDSIEAGFPSKWIGPDNLYKEKIDLNIEVSHYWNPTMEDEETCRYWLREKIDKEIGRIKAEMDALGYIEKKRIKRNIVDLEYLVEYQVKMFSYKDIIKKYKVADKIKSEYQAIYNKSKNKQKLTDREQKAYDVFNDYAYLIELAKDRLYKSVNGTAEKIGLTLR